MPGTRLRSRRRGKLPEEARRPGAASSAEPANAAAQAKQLPAYMRGQGVSPGVPLLRPGGVAGAPEVATPGDDAREAVSPAAPSAVPEGASPEEAAAAVERGRADEERERVEAAAAPDAAGVERPAHAAETPEPVPDVTGVGETTEAVAYASVSLQGKTNARFKHSYTTAKVKKSQAEGCEGCGGKECARFTGVIVSTYTVTTTVSLPKVSDFPDLTACQRQRVRDAINNVLAPHEQQHVAAFNTYTGTVTTPFDVTICSADFGSTIKALHDSEAGAREASAQALSDALDPFEFDVDLDCEEPEKKAENAPPEGGAEEANA